jgi:hypothetical protein
MKQTEVKTLTDTPERGIDMVSIVAAQVSKNRGFLTINLCINGSSFTTEMSITMAKEFSKAIAETIAELEALTKQDE